MFRYLKILNIHTHIKLKNKCMYDWEEGSVGKIPVTQI